MDASHHLQVLWRARSLLIAGVLAGCMLAVVAAFHVRWDGGLAVEWRGKQTWQSSSTLFVTQNGFPWGRVTLPAATLNQGGAPATAGTDGQPNSPREKREFGAPERFSDLAVLYSYLANSQQVRALIRSRPRERQILISPVQNATTGVGLPLLKVAAQAHSPTAARKLNGAAIAALREYLEAEQRDADISPLLRVRIQVLNPPSRAVVTAGRSYIPSLIAFMLAIAAAIGLAYLLENLRLARWRRRDGAASEPTAVTELQVEAGSEPSSARAA